MRRALFAAAIALSVSTAAHAANMMFFMVGGGGGAAGPACNAGQLDFSDATGCNLTLYMVILR